MVLTIIGNITLHLRYHYHDSVPGLIISFLSIQSSGRPVEFRIVNMNKQFPLAQPTQRLI